MRLSILIITMFVSFGLKAIDLNEKEIRENIMNCKVTLDKMDRVLDKTYVFVRDWVFIDKADNTPSKLELISYLDSDTLDSFFNALIQYKYIFPNELFDKLIDISSSIHTITHESRYITKVLSSFESYDDPFIVFEVKPNVELGGSISVAVSKAKDNIKSLMIYCDYLLEQKKIKPIVEINIKSQDKKQLIVDLFESCKIRNDISNYVKQISSRGYYYGDNEKILLENSVYKILLEYYYDNFDIQDIVEIQRFYDSSSGQKILILNGFLSLRLIETMINNELENK